MERDYLDFDVSIEGAPAERTVQVTSSPAGTGSAPFTFPFGAVELAQFMMAVGPPRATSRRLVPAEARVVDVKDYGRRLGDALLAGDVGQLFRVSLSTAKQQGAGLRVRLGLQDSPDLDPVPWEYLYDGSLGRFLTLSSQTPVVRALEALDVPPAVRVAAPLRVLVLISSPTDVPELAVTHEKELLEATTADLVKSGRLEMVVLETATLSSLQRALLETFHVFHFIGHGGFDQAAGEGVLVLEREDGTAHRVGASRLGTLLHDADGMQLVVLNACEGARTSGRDAFSGVAQALVRQGLPAVVAMQTEISDRAALVFSHEFYYFLTRGLPIDAAMCEVRKAMATSDEASEWGTAVLVRSGSDQPFDVTALGGLAEPAPEGRWESLYAAAKSTLGSAHPEAAVPILEQLVAERPDYADATMLLERVKQKPASSAADTRADTTADTRADTRADTAPTPERQTAPIPAGAGGPVGAPHFLDAPPPPHSTQPTPPTQPPPTGPQGQPPTQPATQGPIHPLTQPSSRPSSLPTGPPTGPPMGRPLVPTAAPPIPPTAPAHTRTRAGGGRWKWLAIVLGVLLAATIGFIALAISMADDPVVPTPDKSQGAVVQPPTPGPGPDSEPPPNGNVDDPAVAACGPAAAIPAVDGAILVGCTTTKPVIDGSFSEWENVPATSIDAVVFPQDGSNPNGVHGEARLLWDREALYVQFSVVDPARRDVDEGQPDQYWRGDAVSFEFGPDARALAAGTRVRDDVDRHVIIGISGDRALADINPASRGDFPSGSAAPEIDAAVIATADGYHVEARVPWSSLAVEQPARGAVFAGNLNISDAQIARKWDLGTMVSSNPQRTIQRQPLVWQPIVLGDPS